MPFLDARHGRHDLTRRAVAALQCVVIDEGLLHRMKVTTRARQPFNGQHRTSVRLHSWRQARHDPAAVQMHRAGAALTVIATLLPAGEIQVFAQQIKQRGARIDCHRPRLAIDGQRHADAFCFTACALVGSLPIDCHSGSHTCRWRNPRLAVSSPLFMFLAVIAVLLIGEQLLV